MKNNILLKMNLLVGSIIVLGFIVVSALYYKHSVRLYMEDIEDVAGLTSEGIFYRMEFFFSKPVNVSLTMAHDSLLKSLLEGELERLEDPAYTETIKNYLNAYRIKYDYDSVFLVSARTGRYYNFRGLDRTLTEGNPENGWYYKMLESEVDYDLEVDNDEAADNEITVFVNARISDPDGRTLGLVGVGLRAVSLQAMLLKYEAALGVKTFLVGPDGRIEVSTDKTAFEEEDHFAASSYGHLKEAMLSRGQGEEVRSFWHRDGYRRNFIVSKYIPALSWHLIVEHNTDLLDRQMRSQVLRHLLITVLLILVILWITTRVIRDYNRRLVEITRLREEDRQEAVHRATEKLHGSIYTVNLTKDCAEGDSTRARFASFGAPADTPFSDMLKIIAEKEIKEKFRAGYIRTFLPENALREFHQGNTELRYEFQAGSDGRNYHWTRIVAHIYQNNDDESIYLISYHKNIDEEKQRELRLANQIEMDEMTGLLNKTATRRHIEEMLAGDSTSQYAFFIFDIDNFKTVNDRFGHAAGDSVIIRFAAIIKRSFRARDVVGRIGGDEFVVFVPVPGRAWVEQKAAALSLALNGEQAEGKNLIKFTASIGVALAPADGSDFETLYKNADQALYATKQRGKNTYTLFAKTP